MDVQEQTKSEKKRVLHNVNAFQCGLESSITNENFLTHSKDTYCWHPNVNKVLCLKPAPHVDINPFNKTLCAHKSETHESFKSRLHEKEDCEIFSAPRRTNINFDWGRIKPCVFQTTTAYDYSCPAETNVQKAVRSETTYKPGRRSPLNLFDVECSEEQNPVSNYKDNYTEADLGTFCKVNPLPRPSPMKGESRYRFLKSTSQSDFTGRHGFRHPSFSKSFNCHIQFGDPDDESNRKSETSTSFTKPEQTPSAERTLKLGRGVNLHQNNVLQQESRNTEYKTTSSHPCPEVFYSQACVRPQEPVPDVSVNTILHPLSELLATSNYKLQYERINPELYIEARKKLFKTNRRNRTTLLIEDNRLNEEAYNTSHKDEFYPKCVQKPERNDDDKDITRAMPFKSAGHSVYDLPGKPISSDFKVFDAPTRNRNKAFIKMLKTTYIVPPEKDAVYDTTYKKFYDRSVFPNVPRIMSRALHESSLPFGTFKES